MNYDKVTWELNNAKWALDNQKEIWASYLYKKRKYEIAFITLPNWLKLSLTMWD